jgi:anti-sigma B factor antagonist
METLGAHLRVHGRLEDGVARFTINGDVDLASGQTIRQAVSEALDEGAREVVLDLAGVTLLDSSGLNCLLNTARDVDRRGGKLSCEAPHGSECRIVIDLAGVSKLLNLSE